jgi:hypothetical protein
VTRGPFWLTTRRCLRVGAWPVALAAALAVLLHHAVPPVLGDRTAPAAASPWLVLPLLVAAASTTLTAIVTWPLFARDEPGNDVLARIQRGACGGCAAALAGALVAQGLLTLPTALLVPFALGAPATARLVHVLETSGTTVLARGHDAVDFTLPSAARVERIELRPRAGLPEGTFAPAAIGVELDGDALPPTVAFEQTNERRAIDFPPREVRQVRIVRRGGTVPLWFPAGSAVGIGADRVPTWRNACWLTTIALAPSLAALALAALLGRVAGRPTLLLAAGATLFLCWIGDAGPAAPAATRVLAGEALADAGLFPATAPLLALGLAALSVAAMTRARSRR